ncbi:cysteine desulfurase [Candidatus Saccharibacteria bacterium]|nr:cysteine desulfurase [Candidatus Saccharibacteria bacterium]
MKKIYLDYAAATPLDPKVLEAMKPYFSSKFYNPSAIYLEGRKIRRDLDEIRHKVAEIIGAKPAEIIFTAGATEANNLAIQGTLSEFPEGEILVSAIEHESVLEPARLFKNTEIPVDKNGQIILNKLSILINDKTVLVSVILVNNELGSIQPLKEIANIIKKVRKQRLASGNEMPIYLHTDAAQAGNYLDLHVSRLGIDLMSLNGGKIYGPKQSGALYVKAGTNLKPLILGGGQEFGLRSGTENLAATAGFAQALTQASEIRHLEAKRVMELRQLFENHLKKKIPNVVINGGHNRAPHLVNVTLPGIDNERLMMELDEAGIMCAVGSACSAARDEASHVLSAIGLEDSQARSTLRFSLGKNITKADIEKTVNELTRLTSSK